MARRRQARAQSAVLPLPPWLVQDRPHRLGRHRRPLGRELGGDLGHRAVLGPPLQHLVADGVGLARPLGPRLGRTEELGTPGAQLGGKLVQCGRRVAEASGGLGRRDAIDQVGPQRLVTALRGQRGLEEVLGAGPHSCR